MPNFIGDPTKVTLFNNLKIDYAVKMFWYPMTLNCPQDYMLIPALLEPKPQWPKDTPRQHEKYYGAQSITHLEVGQLLKRDIVKLRENQIEFKQACL